MVRADVFKNEKVVPPAYVKSFLHSPCFLAAIFTTTQARVDISFLFRLPENLKNNATNLLTSHP